MSTREELPPLVEGVDVPDDALGEDLVLVPVKRGEGERTKTEGKEGKGLGEEDTKEQGESG